MAEAKEIGKKVLKFIVGLVLIGLAVFSYLYWWPDLLTLIKGGLGLVLILIGIIFIILAFTD